MPVTGSGPLRILVFCGMSEKKLRQKLAPLQAMSQVEEIIIVRRKPFQGDKIVNYTVPKPLRGNFVTAEAWRFLTMLYVSVFRPADLVVCMTLLPHGLHARVASLLRGRPLVSHIMGYWEIDPPQAQRGLLARLRMRIVQKSDVLLVRGARSRARLIDTGAAADENIFIQQNVFDFAGYRPDESLPKQYDLVFIGNLEPNKNLDVLLAIVDKLNQRGRRVQLAVAGDGKLRAALEQHASLLQLGEQVRFLGRQNEEQVVKLLQQSKIFVMTSLAEGMPQVVIEAMACGLPCVLFDAGDVREIVVQGSNGVLIPPGNLDAFAEAVERLLTDPEQYHQMSLAACRIRKEYLEVFSVQRQTDLWSHALKVATQAVET